MSEEKLSSINQQFIELVCGLLGISTTIRRSEEFIIEGNATEKLINICNQLDCSDYFTGPAAKNYLDESLFEAEGINLYYLDYSGYPEYNQMWPNFEHGVSVLDLLFNTGPDVKQYLKYF